MLSIHGQSRLSDMSRTPRTINEDMDYSREYFRPRGGEFLTRGAALAASKQLSNVPNVLVAPDNFGPRTRARLQPLESEQQHVLEMTHQPQHALHNPHGQQGQQQAQHGQQHQQQRRVAQHIRQPAILRKKLDTCIYFMSSMGVHMEVEEGSNASVQDLLQALMEFDLSSTDPALSPLPLQTMEVFTLWMTSPLLELQLKPHHRPFHVRRDWNHFLQRFSSAPLEKKAVDEPVLCLQRNVFCSRRDESRLMNQHLTILELLYEEAKYNVLSGRYPCELADYFVLGGIQARVECDRNNTNTNNSVDSTNENVNNCSMTASELRSQLANFLPPHVLHECEQLRLRPTLSNLSSMLLRGLQASHRSHLGSPEQRLSEQLRSIPASTSRRRLMRKYVEFCRSLPYYGAAFFQGQIETPSTTLTSLLINSDSPVLIAINAHGLHVIDTLNVVVLLGLKWEELSWDYAKPSQEGNVDCLPCLFVQFCVIENGRRVSKILQIFSRQAVQMDALIATFVDEVKQRIINANNDDDDANNTTNNNSNNNPNTNNTNNNNRDNIVANESSGGGNGVEQPDDCSASLTTVSRRGIPESCLNNKLNRLTLATFDEEGHCIGHMGSWSFSN